MENQIVIESPDGTAFVGGTVTFAPTGAAPNTFRVGTTGVISALLRIQRNFYS